MKILIEIQQKLKAPKSQMNSFGKYSYRSCEDILEAVKPLLGEATLVITDEIVIIGNRYYVKATASLKDGQDTVIGIAYARESESKKGMDESQITGATSSYARKYALNGLFLIDDTKDADARDNSDNAIDYGKEKPKKLSNFEQAMKVIKSEKDKEKLKDWRIKISGSVKYTEEERFEVLDFIDDKLKK